MAERWDAGKAASKASGLVGMKDLRTVEASAEWKGTHTAGQREATTGRWLEGRMDFVKAEGRVVNLDIRWEGAMELRMAAKSGDLRAVKLGGRTDAWQAACWAA